MIKGVPIFFSGVDGSCFTPLSARTLLNSSIFWDNVKACIVFNIVIYDTDSDRADVIKEQVGGVRTSCSWVPTG